MHKSAELALKTPNSSELKRAMELDPEDFKAWMIKYNKKPSKGKLGSNYSILARYREKPEK